MADQSGPSRIRVGMRASVAIAIAAGLAGCGFSTPASQGDPSAPILVRGRILDRSGAPIAGAELQIDVNDFERSQVGQPVPVLFRETYRANPDGTFAIHLAPTPALADAAARNGGYVNFHLLAFGPNRTFVFPFNFPRQLAGNGWGDEVPEVVLTPDGIRQPGSDPGVQAPLPVAT